MKNNARAAIAVDSKFSEVFYVFIIIWSRIIQLYFISMEVKSFLETNDLEHLWTTCIVSLLSDRVFGTHPVLDVEKDDRKPPPDKYYLALLFCFFSGVTGLIPVTFFLTANDYWMYKLRDTSYSNYDAENKTFLQKMFLSFNTITTAIPSVISVLLTTKFGHKLSMRNRFLLTLGSTSFMFVAFTSLVKINTDSWQNLFFGLSLSILGLISLGTPLYAISNITFMSRFPLFYLTINMIGTAVGGLFGSTLQLISLSIGQNPTDVGLIYFSSGTLLIIFTFVLAYLIKYSPVVTFYGSEKLEEKNNKSAPSFKEYRETALRIWPLLMITLVQTLVQGMGHPNISSLVVSEGYVKDGDNLWYEKYFVVVATFLSYDFFQLVGRFFGKPVITKTNYWWWLVLATARSIILGPIFMFCNSQPREHLPVWFPHDYQYMIIMAVYSVSSSILLSIQFMSVSNLAGDKTELAYVLMMAAVMLLNTLFSPLSSVIVIML